MSETLQQSGDVASDRAALRRRVKQMYDGLNAELWEKCLSLIDPRLREGDQPAVEPGAYAESLSAFKKAYGVVRPWYTRINLYPDGSRNKRDHRPFAYVYVVWQDRHRGFHVFTERWVKDSGHWYSRVVGLVPNRQDPAKPSD